jgi:hypothetical protein
VGWTLLWVFLAVLGSYWNVLFREFSRLAAPRDESFVSSEPRMGEIRLHAEPTTASVYLNEAYAGRVQDLRTIQLAPGIYNLKIETEGLPAFTRRVYVLSGKAVTIEANLLAAQEARQP